jgi:hypothetical protein
MAVSYLLVLVYYPVWFSIRLQEIKIYAEHSGLSTICYYNIIISIVNFWLLIDVETIRWLIDVEAFRRTKFCYTYEATVPSIND